MERKDLIYRVLREVHKNGENELLIALADKAGITLSVAECINMMKLFAPSPESAAMSLKKEYMELRRCFLEGDCIKDKQIRERFRELKKIFGNDSSGILESAALLRKEWEELRSEMQKRFCQAKSTTDIEPRFQELNEIFRCR